MDDIKEKELSEESDEENTQDAKESAKIDPPKQSEPIAQKSRMRRTLERQSKRNIFLMGLGLILIIAALVVYGQSIVINLSLLLGQTKSQPNQQSVEDDIVYIAPPVLDPVASATNSARAIFTGQITNADQVKLYINNELVDVTKPEKDNTFTFEDVDLKEGKNSVKAYAYIKNKKSDESNIVTVNFLKEPPEVTIEQPGDGDSFQGPSNLTVKGKTDPSNTVKVNGNLTITRDDGSFSANIVLNSGENKIKIEVTDNAGNKTEKEITVHYAP